MNGIGNQLQMFYIFIPKSHNRSNPLSRPTETAENQTCNIINKHKSSSKFNNVSKHILYNNNYSQYFAFLSSYFKTGHVPI